MKKEIEEKIVYPDYNNSIVNLACSIQNHYGIKPKHPTIPQVDEILSRNYRHVVVILLDGFGLNIMNKHLYQMDFLNRHVLMEYSSVFPPTTTASTTSMLTGLTPIEHGWLGWDLYFEKEDKSVTCFTNTLQNSSDKAADYSVANKYLPYETIVDQINKTEKYKAYMVMPPVNPEFRDLSKWTYEIRKNCRKKERNFTYAYFENPDNQMHSDGTGANSVHSIIEELNATIDGLCEMSKETVFFITADHGHTDIQNSYLCDYPEITKMLERPFCIESRAASFYVKPEYKNQFPEEFNKHFGEDYILFTKQEALDKAIFGPGFAHENLTGLGDYLAVATTSRTLVWDKNCKSFKSHHAGMTEDEMKIPLIWFENKPNKAGIISYYTVISLIIGFIFYILFW